MAHGEQCSTGTGALKRCTGGGHYYHPLVGEVRGEGLIAAVELVKQKQPRTPFDPGAGVGAYCAAACQDAGVILRNLGDSVAFCPPLIITEDQIDELVNKFSIGLDATLDWAIKTHLI